MPKFTGTYTAIITPFTADNAIDWAAFEQLVEAQIAGGVEGIVFVGTTGESPTLTHAEHKEIIAWATKTVAGRVQVIVGTGSNSTAESIAFATVAAEAGTDAQLVVNPYYNKPRQEGLYQHFTAIADATDVPVILYNIAGRTGVNIETDTLLRLVSHKNIVGVKEASGDICQMMDVLDRVPDDFAVLVGDDGLILPFIAAGGHGVVSVISNALPRETSDLVRQLLTGDIVGARTAFYALRPLMQACFAETNPIPIKELMAQQGCCQPSLRLPLTRASEATQTLLKKSWDARASS